MVYLMNIIFCFFFQGVTRCSFFFFFSSRRRHTRFDCDWSSDVCSSDLSAEYGWLVDALREQPYRDAILDGEIVALDEQGHPSFQLLQNRGSEPRPHLVYYAFDLLLRDGYDLRGVPLERRKALLTSSLFPVPGDRVRIVEAFPEHGTSVYAAALENGMEGIVAKRRDSRY